MVSVRSLISSTMLVLVSALEASGTASTMRVQVDIRLNNKQFSIGKWNADGTHAVTRLDFFLSGFELQRVNGDWVAPSERIVYVSGEQVPMRFGLPQDSAGRFRAIRFAVGLDATTNASNPAEYPAGHPLNPNVNDLYWDWQHSYIFMALEGYYRGPSGEQAGFSYHIGNDSNRTVVELPCAVDLSSGDALSLTLHVDRIFPDAISKGANDATHSREGDPLVETLTDRLRYAWEVAITSAEQVAPRGTGDAQKATGSTSGDSADRLGAPPSFPEPVLPLDNPLTGPGIALGKKLFFDKRLSGDNSQSCADCHRVEHAFSDRGNALSKGVDGRPGKRNSMSLMNLAWQKSFFWDGRESRLREQVLVPIQDPLEMNADLSEVLRKLEIDSGYARQFESVFGTPGISTDRLGLALEQFLLTRVTHESKFDRFRAGKAELSDEESRGLDLFFTEHDPRINQFGADCFHCHAGTMFTTHRFANNGLDETFADGGRFAVTGRAEDRGKFKTPSLRNVAVTGPYMHDGRFESLDEVIDHYDSGVKRSTTLDPNLAKHPPSGLSLSKTDKRALVAFLKTLTDDRFAGSEEYEPN